MMTEDEKKGYLFYIYRVGVGFNYKPVDPKYYSEEGLKNFAKQYAKDGVLYKTEKECQDIINTLNAGLHAKFDFSNTNGMNLSGVTTVENGYILVEFPSGRTLKLKVDPVYEEIYIEKVKD